MGKILFYRNGDLQSEEGPVVREFPVVLTVNGRELATLIASPHDLNFLVAGFLRLQGFVRDIGDLEMLGVCDDFGIANVQIRGELPQRLRPTLTSGCGTGITFTLAGIDGEQVPVVPAAVFTSATVLALMEELARKAENYRNHGGIHSAAVGDEGGIILAAEDIGRHNTLDRIAGEALLKGIALAGKALVTSGRVSTEMVAKAIQLGISLIASRTSPTDMAVKMCEEAGITLIGYLRSNKFNVYSHPEGLLLPRAAERRRPVKPVAMVGIPGQHNAMCR
jgi:FdhD protein